MSDPQSPEPAGAPGRATGRGSHRASRRLDETAVLAPARPRPAGGWRRLLLQTSGGALNPGPSSAQARRSDQDRQLRRSLRGCHRVAVLSLKGGVGKTTTSIGLGATLASVRGDRVVAVDANPDRGTLADRVDEQAAYTVRDLLTAAPDVTGYHDVRHFTSQAASRLEVLGSERDPARSVAFCEADYRETVQLLERFYTVILTDCGTGLLHSAMRGVLELADALVVVTSPALDGARSAAATLDWLDAHGYAALAASSVTVVSGVGGGGTVNVDRIEDFFRGRCRGVVQVPYDRHLETGAQIDLDRLGDGAREAYRQLALLVTEGFPPQPAAD